VAITTVLGGRDLFSQTPKAMISTMPAPPAIVCHRVRFVRDDEGEGSFMVLGDRIEQARYHSRMRDRQRQLA
jgi:hypothetical protein